MKKTLVIVLALALVLAASALTLTACNGKVYEGEYAYYAWDYAQWKPSTTHQYGCKVSVRIQGDVITEVIIHEDTDIFYNVSAGWTAAYGAEYGYDSEGKTNWRLHGQEMADSFVGLTTAEVLKIKTYVSKYNVTGGSVIPAGQPVTTGGVETIKYLPAQVNAVIGQYGNFGYTAGATQSAGRLVLAIQDAILKSQGKTTNPNCVEYDVGRVVTGEYSYENTWTPGQFYGCKVTVTVKDNKITAVEVTPDTSTYYNLSTGWANKDLWLDDDGAMAQSFVGLTVDQVKAMKVICNDKGQPDTSADVDTITGLPSGWNYVVGATQSSGRLILAIQDALNKLA